MLTLTHPRETLAHRLPAGAKLLALAGAALVVFRLGAPGLAAAAGVLALICLALGVDVARAVLRGLVPLWPFVAILLIWHAISGNPGQGAMLSARMLVMVGLANLVTLTTPISAMIAVIERLLRPLARLGLPPRAVALAMALVVRFAPVLMQKQRLLAMAWRARARRRPGWRLVLPMVIMALDEADHVADALRARGGVSAPDFTPPTGD